MVELNNGKLRVPNAFVTSEKAEVGIKASFYQGEREGMVYARFKKFDTLVKRFDGKRDVDVIKARALMTSTSRLPSNRFTNVSNFLKRAYTIPSRSP